MSLSTKCPSKPVLRQAIKQPDEEPKQVDEAVEHSCSTVSPLCVVRLWRK